MKKSLLALILVLATLLTFAVPAFAADGDPAVTPGLDNFKPVATYSDQFTDVAAGEWYVENVKTAFELGLMKGTSETTFNVKGNLSIAEAITLAARLHSVYNTGETLSLEATDTWYAPYIAYAVENGIVSDFEDYTVSVTRADFARVFASALPKEALEAVNTINAIPDVKEDDTYGEAVYLLYRAGILTGGDKEGTFAPTTNIARSEAAAIVTRMASKELRKSITLPPVEDPAPADKTYYNGYLGLSVKVPADWKIEDIDATTMTATSDASKDIDKFNATEFGDGGFGISLIDIWNRENSGDDEHVGLWLSIEDYRDVKMSEDEYYKYFNETYGGTSESGYLYTLKSQEKATVGGQQYMRFRYLVTHPDNADAYYSDYYVRAVDTGVYFVMNVTYWENNVVGAADAKYAIETLVSFS